MTNRIPTMRLCGIDPPEYQHLEPVAAQRVHLICENLQKKPLGYDSFDMALTLANVHDSAQGIIEAVQSGKPCDLHGEKLDAKTVNRELTILVKDLKTTRDVVNKVLGTEEAIRGWGEYEGALERIGASLKELATAEESMQKLLSSSS